ncbi:MAG TPA: ROK family protein [Brachybacterium sp.]
MTTAKTTAAFGIDIGGSGIKGAPVDLREGGLSADRVRIATPQPSTPDAVADTVRDLVDSFDLPRGIPVGVTFPAVIQQGVAKTAANVDDAWIGTDVDALLTARTGHDVFVVNDADAAGVAEMEFGAGKDQKGVVLVITLGTGVGSAMFVDGVLVPNAELGHLPLKGDSAEKFMASSVREKEDLSWKKWSKRLQKYFSLVEFLFSPDLIIVGGGVSKQHEKFLPRLELNTPIVPAQLRNEAGIVGAAALAGREVAAAGGTGDAPVKKLAAERAPAVRTTADKKAPAAKKPPAKKPAAKKATTTTSAATKPAATKPAAKKSATTAASTTTASTKAASSKKASTKATSTKAAKSTTKTSATAAKAPASRSTGSTATS